MDAKWKVHPILDADGTCAHKHLHCLLLRSCGANNGIVQKVFISTWLRPG